MAKLKKVQGPPSQGKIPVRLRGTLERGNHARASAVRRVVLEDTLSGKDLQSETASHIGAALRSAIKNFGSSCTIENVCSLDDVQSSRAAIWLDEALSRGMSFLAWRIKNHVAVFLYGSARKDTGLIEDLVELSHSLPVFCKRGGVWGGVGHRACSGEGFNFYA